LAQGSGEHVFGAMQPESTRPKRSLLAKTLCLLALLGAVYVLATGMPTMVTGAFSAVSFMRPMQASRAAGVTMDDSKAGGLERLGDVRDKTALAKSEDLRLAYQQRNPAEPMEEQGGYGGSAASSGAGYSQGRYRWWETNWKKEDGGVSPWAGSGGGKIRKRDDPNLAANLAKAEEQRLAFKQRNPDNGELPSYLPFGEKMGGGRQGPSGEAGPKFEDRYKYTYYQDKFGSK